MNNVIHLIMIHRWYDLIDSGHKTIEYRDATEYYRKRLKNKTKVCFHRGYTNITMTFHIFRVFETPSQFEIYLGKRA